MDVKEDIFCEEGLGLKIEFLKFGYEVKNKLLKIVNTIFEKGEVPSDFRTTLLKPCTRKVVRVSVVLAWFL
jgi:hypothetical protein